MAHVKNVVALMDELSMPMEEAFALYAKLLGEDNSQETLSMHPKKKQELYQKIFQKATPPKCSPGPKNMELPSKIYLGTKYTVVNIKGASSFAGKTQKESSSAGKVETSKKAGLSTLATATSKVYYQFTDEEIGEMIAMMKANPVPF